MSKGPVTGSKLLSSCLVAVAGLTIGFGLVATGRMWLSPSSSGGDDRAAGSASGDTNTVAAGAASGSGDERQSDLPGINGQQVAEETGSGPATLIAYADLVPMSGGGPDRLPGGCDSGEVGSFGDRDSGDLRIACNLPEASFGGLYKQFNATAFRGKLVRFSAELRAAGLDGVNSVEGVGAVWIRIDAPSGPVVNNGRSQGIRGTTGWISRDVSVTVPNNASLISVGFWMQGRGELSARNLRFERL